MYIYIYICLHTYNIVQGLMPGLPAPPSPEGAETGVGAAVAEGYAAICGCGSTAGGSCGEIPGLRAGRALPPFPRPSRSIARFPL